MRYEAISIIFPDPAVYAIPLSLMLEKPKIPNLITAQLQAIIMIVSATARCGSLSNYHGHKLTGCALKMIGIYRGTHPVGAILHRSTHYLLLLLSFSTVFVLYTTNQSRKKSIRFLFAPLFPLLTTSVVKRVSLAMGIFDNSGNQTCPSHPTGPQYGMRSLSQHANTPLLTYYRFRPCRRINDLSSPIHHLGWGIHRSVLPDLSSRIHETNTAFQQCE